MADLGGSFVLTVTEAVKKMFIFIILGVISSVANRHNVIKTPMFSTVRQKLLKIQE